MQVLGRNPRTLLQFVPGALLGVLFSSTPLSKLRLPSFLCSLLGVRHLPHTNSPPLFCNDVVLTSISCL